MGGMPTTPMLLVAVGLLILLVAGIFHTYGYITDLIRGVDRRGMRRAKEEARKAYEYDTEYTGPQPVPAWQIVTIVVVCVVVTALLWIGMNY